MELDLIRRLGALGVKLRLEEGTVRYSAPRGVMTPALLGELKSKKEAIKAFLELALRGSGAAEPPPIAPVPRADALPLSFAQERLWFLDQLAPDSAHYNLPLALRMRGALDVGALARAFTEVVARHEVLRTTLVARGDSPVQVVHPAAAFPLPVVDLSALPAGERERELVRRATEEAVRPFPLAQGPLLRTSLVRLGEADHALLVTMHHVVADGWSMGVLVREMAALYAAFSAGAPSPLPPLAIQYADFAAWQRQWLQGDVLAGQIAYWREKLAGAPLVDLPIDRARPPVETHRGARVTVALPAEVTAALRRIASESGATLFMTALSAFLVLLQRHTGQDDLSVGTPVAGRGRAEIEPLIGFFVNTLVLRADLSGDPSFVELVKRVRAVALGAYAHEDVPFERLVEALDVQRDLSRNPLFQVLFALERAAVEPMSLSVLEMNPLRVEAETAKCDLSLMLAEEEGRLRGSFEYNVDLFDAAAIERMARRFEVLAAGIAAHPDGKIGALDVQPVEEKRIQASWNDTAEAYPREACAHELFEAQVERTPDAIAVVFGEECLSYRELDARANRLARHLRARGVGAEVRVALCLERSLEMVIGILGALKAGGAYVPLDPSYPPERLAFMLEDTAAPVLVTQERLLARLPITLPATVVIDRDAVAIAGESSERVAGAASPGNIAYVIYTSGSTGRPKGVLVEHRSFCHIAHAQARMFEVHEGSRFLQLVRFGFDVAVGEVLTTLAAGGTLCLAPEDPVLPGPELARIVREQRIEILNLPPSALVGLPFERFPSLRSVTTGAEACPADVVARWAEHCRFLNAYGPTETTITATFAECKGDGAKPPIGRPLSNTRVFVLDRDLRPAPIGAAGELYIGGAGVARGYLNAPGLTADRFVPSPERGAPGERLYRTGDLVRFRHDGQLEFLGRVDHQVKLRGFRIELGEIEATLEAHPGVGRAVALVREDVPGDRRLVAYVALSAASAATAGELRAHARRTLPDYMVPSALVVMDALPLSPNGKVDRKALPPPDALAPDPDAVYVAPRTPEEEIVAGVFAAVLRLPRVSAEGDFFELGGHSLLATQAVLRIRTALSAELPLRALFEAKTPAGVARLALACRDAEPAPPMVPVSRAAPLPLSFAQQRLWFLDRLEPGRASYNLPMALRLRGALDVGVLSRALLGLVRRHESLRTTFAQRAEGPVQVIHPAPDAWPLPLTDLSDLPDEEREQESSRRVVVEAERPFDLEAGPLFRAALLRLGPEEHVLLVTMHHIISDGWSIGVVVRESAVFYEASASGQAPALAELPLQYADFAGWQRAWLTGSVLEAQLAYWRSRLAGAPTLELSTDRPRPPVHTGRGAQQALSVPADVLASLERLSRKQGATLFMTLLSVLDVLLHRYTGQDDLCVGTPIAGRTRAEVEPMVGFFVNTLVLRADLSDRPTFLDLLDRTREAALGAYTHQDVPFEKLVETLGIERDLSRAPLFQVLLSLQNAPAEETAWGGLSMESLPQKASFAKFDLEFLLADVGGKLEGTIVYSADLFEPATIARMAGHFEALLRAVAADPSRRVAELPMLSETERQTLLVDWNDTGARDPAAFVHRRVAAHAALAPGALAVVAPDGTLTYGELLARSTRLASRLAKLGVGPEVRVGVHVERSAAMVVALLAVLMAGGAYVPMDPTYPADRLAFMIEDAEAPLVLTRGGSLAGYRGRVLDLDAELAAASLDAGEIEAPSPALDADHVAYVIYTSGSTGKPKGVENRHGGLANLVRWFLAEYEVKPGDRLAQQASMGFDACGLELWPGLAGGATAHIIEEDTRLSPALLVDWLLRERITVAHLPPVLAEPLVEGDLPEGLALRALLTGSDKVTRSPKRSLPFRFANHYGPTECSVLATWGRIEPSERGEAPPIGRPLPGVEIYLLDAELQPVPIGVPGELYIGGVGLGRGYGHRPGMTAERFVPHPFAREPGARLYRTGDRARYLPNGNLVFLGRADFQVKLRGFRIELGEVESALLSHPAVEQAVVIAREDAPGSKRLVAYVVAAGEVVAGELREHLAQSLPVYMVPSAVVFLAALPLTPNGKIDRRALPAPSESDAAQDRAYVAPRGAVEEIVAGILCEVLGVRRAGVDDDFFALGGHSLLATQVVSRIRAALGVELPLRALFEAPTVAGLAAAVTVRLGEGTATLAPPIVRVAREAAMPLSFGQRRLWFLHRLDPDSAFYNVPAALRLRGPLDAAVLGSVLVTIVRRHEVLRTTFEAREGLPVQVIEPPPDAWPLPCIDVREGDLALRVAEEARRPFDLAKGPLLRVSLLRLGAEDHVLVVTLHHIVSDAWSMSVFVGEVAALYAAFASREPSPLPELAVQYADFAAWQASWLSGDVLEQQTSYWRERLAGAPTLELPTDRPRPSVPSYRGGHTPFSLSPDLAAGLVRLGRARGATLFMTLLAAFQVLLQRYSGQDDFCVGTPVAGRDRAETEPLIGFFVNTLVLRADLSGDPTAEALIDRVKETALGAYAHQDLPFERVVEAAAAPRDLSRNPLFQVLFSMQSGSAGALSLPGLSIETVPLELGTAQFDLTLSIADGASGLSGALEHNTDLFDEATAARMAAHYVALLEAFAADPGRTIGDLPLLSPEERAQIVVAWNDTAADFPRDACVHELFEAQARRTPDSAAVVLGAEQLTYAELDARANQLAHHLQGLGVGPEVRVGLCVDRSLDLVVGVLGVLKAGGAYVPIDPAYPIERLAFMLEDAAVPVLVTEEALSDRLPAHAAVVVCLDTGWDAIALESAEPPPGLACADNLAYVIYTSGSTGRPKGAMIPHRGLVNYLGHCQAAYPVSEGRGAPVHSSIGFDLTVTSLYAPLLAGGRVVLVPEGQGAAPLGEVLRRETDFSLVKITPAHLEALGHELSAAGAAGRTRAFVIGGEALSSASLAFFQENAPDTRLFNEYGPTETVVGCSVYEVPRGGCPSADVPIGRPIQNTQIHVLDAALRPVPIGATGEIHVGGAGVARGYMGRPGLTADRFVPDPFGEPGARMYRTGDLGRLTADGTLAFLGRRDQQVKLRGYRIELGEIEAALRQHRGVADAAVLLREDTPGDRRLVAYVVARDGSAPAADALHAHLGAALPAYMIPSAFVALSALPLTDNGKVDRRALPAPDRTRDDAQGAAVAPRSRLELDLAALWEDLLGVSQVGVHDDFFALGGHSLLAVRLLSRVEERFGRAVPLSDLFRSPTIESLAATLEGAPKRSASPLVALRREGSRPPFFCVHATGGSALAYRELAAHLGADQPFYAFHAAGVDPGGEPCNRVEEMARRYVEAMREVQPAGPYRLGGWSFGGVVAFEMARVLEAAGEEVALLALLDARSPADPKPPELDGAVLLALLASELGLPDASAALADLPIEEGLARVAQLAATTGLLPAPAADDFIRRTFAVHRAHMEAERQYVPRNYARQLTIFRCERARQGGLREDDAMGGWAALSSRPAAIHVVPGDHFTMVRAPHVEALARALERALSPDEPS